MHTCGRRSLANWPAQFSCMSKEKLKMEYELRQLKYPHHRLQSLLTSKNPSLMDQCLPFLPFIEPIQKKNGLSPKFLKQCLLLYSPIFIRFTGKKIRFYHSPVSRPETPPAPCCRIFRFRPLTSPGSVIDHVMTISRAPKLVSQQALICFERELVSKHELGRTV